MAISQELKTEIIAQLCARTTKGARLVGAVVFNTVAQCAKAQGVAPFANIDLSELNGTCKAFTYGKAIIRELVNEELISYLESSRILKGGEKSSFGMYTLNGIRVAKACATLAKAPTQGKFVCEWCAPNSTHSNAGTILATRIFRVNLANVARLEKHLEKGRFFKKGFMKMARTDAEREKLEQQRAFAEQAKEYANEFPQGFSFDVTCDFRGRFYYKAGMATPQGGELARLIYGEEDDITLDHRSSFAQLISIVMGSARTAKVCGLTTAEETDFYKSVLKAIGVEFSKIMREGAKAFLMPQAYGAGIATSREGCIREVIGNGGTLAQGESLADKLENFSGLREFGKRAYALAQREGRDNRSLEWMTPSGVKVTQQYFITKRGQWRARDDAQGYYPQTIDLRKVIKNANGEKIVSVNGNANDKSGAVASMANIIQSLDASVMALTVVKFHEKTNCPLWGVHDSYTVKAEHAEALRASVFEAMEEVNTSPEVENLRTRLELPRERRLILKYSESNILSEE